ncbi:MAG: hypothetical protein WCK78_14195 [Paludibacter sp.]
MSQAIIPDDEMRTLAISSLQYANGFYKTLSNSLNSEKSRFDNDMLYNLAVIAVEKYFVGLMARYDWNATHHMPIALYKEALEFEPKLTDNMKQTAILVGKFEAICSLEGFGYRTPTNEDLEAMTGGIKEIKELVEQRIAEI